MAMSTGNRWAGQHDTWCGLSWAGSSAGSGQQPDRVDAFVAISGEVQARIGRLYNRDSAVIYPPVDTGRFTPAQDHDDYFLIVSRLIPYKRIDLAVRAFTELGLPLWIGGEWPRPGEPGGDCRSECTLSGSRAG